MKRFYEDSSQAKTFSSDKSIHYAMRTLSKKPVSEYELRDYGKKPGYIVLARFATKNAALAAKSFHEIQQGCHFAVVAVAPRIYDDYRTRRGW